MKLENFRIELLLWTIGLYMLFNYGFMQLRIPPVKGGGIPIGELVLIFWLLSIKYFEFIPRFAKLSYFYSFLLFLLIGLGRALWGVNQYGFWALRDATNVIESLYLIVGLSFVLYAQSIDRFFKWLPKILILIFLYALSYPFGRFLSIYSPKLMAGAGHKVSLFFNYIGIPLFLLWGAVYLMLFKKPKDLKDKIILLVVLTFIWGYTIAFFQSRTIYLQVAGILAILSLFRRDLLKIYLLTLLLAMGVIVLLPKTGLHINGRLGQPVSSEFIVHHLESMSGVSHPDVEGAAKGVYLRLKWWKILYEKSTADTKSFFFGMGYGFPLVDFIAYGDGYDINGQIVREPHNSFISIFSRIGFVGFFFFCLLHVQLIRVWLKNYKMSSELKLEEEKKRLLVLMVYFVLVWINAIGEDALEKPFFAIPYYFFWGIALCIPWNIRSLFSYKELQ